MRGRPEDRCAGGLGGEALRRVDLRDPRSQRPDDPPAARVGAERPSRVADETMTQDGTSKSSASRCPEAMSASAMMPIVFCASFVPCVNATKLPETSCARRKTRFTLLGRAPPDQPDDRRSSARTRSRSPMSGESTPGMTTFSQMPLQSTTSSPAAAIARPGDARRSARGSSSTAGPRNHVIRFQVIAPTRPARTTLSVIASGSTMPFAIVAATFERDERADEVEDRGDDDGRARRQRPRRDARRDRVRGVVEAVREVEEERDDDDRDEREVLHARRLGVLDERCSRSRSPPSRRRRARARAPRRCPSSGSRSAGRSPRRGRATASASRRMRSPSSSSAFSSTSASWTPRMPLRLSHATRAARTRGR